VIDELGAAHRSPDIYLKTDKNPRNPQLGDCLVETEQAIIAQYIRDGEGKDGDK
jgi:hypothetical protein